MTGFESKRNIARNKLDDDDDIQTYQRPWVGLTEWEREAIAHACGAMGSEWLVFIEAVEKALKEKNR